VSHTQGQQQQQQQQQQEWQREREHHQLLPSNSWCGSISGASFAEMTAFFREERAHFEAKLEQQEVKMEALRQDCKNCEEKLEAQRQEYERKLEALRQGAKLEAQCHGYETKLSGDQLEALHQRFDALHQGKLLTDDEMFTLEDKLADFIECRSSATVARGEMLAVAEALLVLVGMCGGVSNDGMLARQLRRKFL
jgi:hypothetical protein